MPRSARRVKSLATARGGDVLSFKREMQRELHAVLKLVG
jgi:hypothetical protein